MLQGCVCCVGVVLVSSQRQCVLSCWCGFFEMTGRGRFHWSFDRDRETERLSCQLTSRSQIVKLTLVSKKVEVTWSMVLQKVVELKGDFLFAKRQKSFIMHEIKNKTLQTLMPIYFYCINTFCVLKKLCPHVSKLNAKTPRLHCALS